MAIVNVGKELFIFANVISLFSSSVPLPLSKAEGEGASLLRDSCA